MPMPPRAPGRLVQGRPPGDWALLALLVATAVALLLSERFWELLPF
jgi:hypothetical protein